MSPLRWNNYLDSAIRFFLYLLIFWLPYSPAVIESCVIICLILWLVKRGINAGQSHPPPAQVFRWFKEFSPALSALNWPIVIFLSACVLSVLNSAFGEQAFHNFLTKTLEWFIVYFLVLEVFTSKRHIHILILVLLITGGATVIDSLVQYYITHKDIFLGRVIVPGGRPTAGFKTSNGLGAYLTILIPVFMSLAFSFRKNGRFWFVAPGLCALSLWSLILTFSRGAWLGTFSGGVLLAFLFLFSKRWKKFYCAAGIMGGVVLLGAALFYMFGNSTGSNISPRSETMFWRLGIWRDSMRMIQDKLFFGHGINTYMPVFEAYRSDPGSNPTYAHNCYIQLAVETGLVGLAAFFMIITRLFKTALAYIKSHWDESGDHVLLSAGILSGIFAFLVHSFFDTNFYSLQLSVYLWFMTGALMAIINMDNRNTTASGKI